MATARCLYFPGIKIFTLKQEGHRTNSPLWSLISAKTFLYLFLSDKTIRAFGIAGHLCDRWILLKVTEMAFR